jgi:hypothetical protein
MLRSMVKVEAVLSPAMLLGLPTYKTTQQHLHVYFIVSVVIIPDFSHV